MGDKSEIVAYLASTREAMIELVRSVQFPRLGEVTAEFFLRHIGRHELAHAKEVIG